MKRGDANRLIEVDNDRYLFSAENLDRRCNGKLKTMNQSRVFANNRASARVLEKTGFAFEGRMRASVFKNEEILDSLLFARIRNEEVLDEVEQSK